MCGIAGVLHHAPVTRPSLAATAAMMAEKLRHRGPDGSGTWVDDESGLALGQTRLAVIDPTEDGAQPMVSRDGRFVLVFNGELYGYRRRRTELEAAGVRFRGNSDTEVLLEAIAYWGLASTLERVDGMFAFALWDRRDRMLHLARDRVGEKPLYYGQLAPGVFGFASQLTALRAHPDAQLEIDRGAVTQLLRYGYVPAPLSIHAGVRKLPPGSLVTVRDGGRSVAPPQSYWSLAEVAVRPRRRVASPQDAVEELDQLLERSVADRMVADVPVGAFLSGGIDSSIVVAMMQRSAAMPVRTFTIGVDRDGYDEAEHARRVATHLGTAHTELYVEPSEVMALIPTLPEVYDEPFADSSQLPTMLVAQLARREVTVALSGDGGDELFAGYTRHQLHARLETTLVRRLPGSVRRVLGRGLERAPAWLLDAAGRAGGVARPDEKARKLAEVLALDSEEAVYRRLVSQWQQPEDVVLGAVSHPDPLAVALAGPMPADPTERMMLLDGLTYLPDDILVKVDRAAMAVSLETRVPLLGREVVEFAWSLPLELKLRDGTGKWLLREVLARHVPRDLFERPKMGFAVPIGEWVRGPLRPWAEEMLSSERLQTDGLLDPAPVRRAWDAHVAGRDDLEYPIWTVLMLSAWLESTRSASSASGVA